MWSCEPCTSIAAAVSGTYIHRCDSSIAELGSCTSLIFSDRALPGQYHPLQDCELAARRGQIGPGAAVQCYTVHDMVPGKFMYDCGDHIEERIVYRDCLTEGSQCGSDSFQVLCGVHRDYQPTSTFWGFDNVLPPDEGVFSYGNIGHITFTGQCVQCQTWAEYSCAGAQVLLNCGQIANDGVTVHPLVDSVAWAGDASGQCMTCGDLGLSYCSPTSLVHSMYTQNPLITWWYPGCDAGTSIEPASLQCDLCNSEGCAASETLVGCGGSVGGICTTCLGDNLRSAVNVVHIAYWDEVDPAVQIGKYPDCTWRCETSYIGMNCVERSWATTQCGLRYRSIGTLYYECRDCMNNIPSTAALPLFSLGVNTFNVVTHGRFEDFVLLNSNGVPQTSVVLPNTNSVMQYIGVEGVPSINPLYALYSDSPIEITYTRLLLSKRTSLSPHAPFQRHTGLEETDCSIIIFITHVSKLRVALPRFNMGILHVSFWTYLHSSTLASTGQPTGTVTVSMTVRMYERAQAQITELTASRSDIVLSMNQWTNARFILDSMLHVNTANGLGVVTEIGAVLLEIEFEIPAALSEVKLAVDDVIAHTPALLLTFEPDESTVMPFVSDGILMPVHAISEVVPSYNSASPLDSDGDPILDLIGTRALYMDPGQGELAMHLQKGRFPRSLNVLWVTLDCSLLTLSADVTFTVSSILSTATGSTHTLEHFSSVFEHLTDGTSVGSGLTWQQVTVSFGLNQFEQTSLEEGLVQLSVTGGPIFLDNIMLWTKPYTCTWECGPMFVRKGEACVPCIAAGECTLGQRYAGCTEDGYTDALVCNDCDPDKPENSFWVDSFEECEWSCSPGFYTTDNVECVPCNTGVTCEIGYYELPCLPRQANVCVPCTSKNHLLVPSAAEYVSAGSAPGLNDCKFECIGAHWLQASSSQCVACSNLDCGSDNVFRATIGCTKTADTRCTACAATSYGMQVVGGSPAPDEPCITSCIEGYYKCIPCPYEEMPGMTKIFGDESELFDFCTSGINGISYKHLLGVRTTIPVSNPLYDGSIEMLFDNVRTCGNLVWADDSEDVKFRSQVAETPCVFGLIVSTTYSADLAFKVQYNKLFALSNVVLSIYDSDMAIVYTVTNPPHGSSRGVHTMQHRVENAASDTYTFLLEATSVYTWRVMDIISIGAFVGPDVRPRRILGNVYYALYNLCYTSYTKTTRQNYAGLYTEFDAQSYGIAGGMFSYDGVDGCITYRQDTLVSLRIIAHSVGIPVRVGFQVTIPDKGDLDFAIDFSTGKSFAGGSISVYRESQLPMQANELLHRTHYEFSLPSDVYLFRYTFFNAEPGTYSMVFECAVKNDGNVLLIVIDIKDTKIYFREPTQRPCDNCPDTISCVECDDSQVPVHATVTGAMRTDIVTNCAWECDTDYSQLGQTCMYCPPQTCAVGTYESDCFTCSPCVAANGNDGMVDFTTAGVTRFEDSCLYECSSEFYEDPFATGIECLPCTAVDCALEPGTFLVPCGRFTNNNCQFCRTCPPGQYVRSTCNVTHDTVCESCPEALPVGASWTSVSECTWECIARGFNATQYIYNPDEQACRFCLPECDTGFYSTHCTAANAWTGCQRCAIPLDAIALSSGTLTNNSCVWTCPPATQPHMVTSETAFCKPNAAVIPPPPPCDKSKQCVRGEKLNHHNPGCECVPCSPGKPSGLLTVWLSEGICKWSCLPPYTPNRERTECVTVTGIANGNADNGNMDNSNTINVTTAQVTPSTSRAFISERIRLVLMSPLVVVSVIVAGVFALKRIRKRRKARQATAAAAS
eukprot:3582888-Rhodomonas_salina.1